MLLNGYTLNTVPLDATAIFKGASSVPVPLNESAAGYLMMYNPSGSVGIPLAEAANGLNAARGMGSTPITMTYYAAAYKLAMAQAIENIGLATSAIGNGISAIGAMVYVGLAESADGRNAARGIAVGNVPLGEWARATPVALGVSLVDIMEMAGRAGIPDPVIIRPGTDAHRSRWMKAGTDERTMTVPAERPSVISRQDRTMRIDADDRSV